VNYADLKTYMYKNKWIIIVSVILVFGYQFGKNMAQHDNDEIAKAVDEIAGMEIK